MYIAKTTRQGNTEFTIRESYLEKGRYRYRHLMTLGSDPALYINYPMERSFYIDDSVTEKLERHMKNVDYEDLETIFWPYIKPDVRRRYDFARSKSKPTPLSTETLCCNVF